MQFGKQQKDLPGFRNPEWLCADRNKLDARCCPALLSDPRTTLLTTPALDFDDERAAALYSLTETAKLDNVDRRASSPMSSPASCTPARRLLSYSRHPPS